MALSSMTGFARSHGASGPYAFEWELKSVNAKGFDLRLRLPQGWDELEAHRQEARRRGAVARHRLRQSHRQARQRALDGADQRGRAGVHREGRRVDLAGRIDAVAPSIDGLLAIKGVIEVVEPESDEDEDKAAKAAAAPLRRSARQISWRCAGAKARRSGRSSSQRMDEIETLAQQGRSRARPQAGGDQGAARRTGRRAARDVRPLRCRPAEPGSALIAAKADIREELDRIASHVAQAREMLGKGGPIGRRLDFLAQEFQPRGQHLLLEIERHRADQYRPRNEERGRAVPRAGPESGVIR